MTSNISFKNYIHELAKHSQLTPTSDPIRPFEVVINSRKRQIDSQLSTNLKSSVEILSNKIQEIWIANEVDNHFKDDVAIIAHNLKSNFNSPELKKIEDMVQFFFQDYEEIRQWISHQLNIHHSIVMLKNLSILILSHLNLVEIPSDISKLSQLKELNLSHNSLTVIPPTLGNLDLLLNLNLSSNQLSTLPSEFENLNKLLLLNLSSNQFMTVPECLFTFCPNCVIDLDKNPLTNESIEYLDNRINSPDYTGPFFINIPCKMEEDEHIEILHVFSDYPFQKLSCLKKREKNSLINWLQRLKELQDYKNIHTHTQFKQETAELLIWFDGFNKVKMHRLFKRLKKSVSTCEDLVGLVRSDLLLEKKLDQIPKNMPLANFYNTLLPYLKLSYLEGIAAEKIVALSESLDEGDEIDNVEVFLHYRLSLQDKLGLPKTLETMRFPNISNLTDDDFRIAEHQIQEKFKNPIPILVINPLWKHRLKKEPLFKEIKITCKLDKEKFLLENAGKEESVYKEFSEKNLTVWNPYYVLTEYFFKNIYTL